MVYHLLEPMLARDWISALPFFAEVLAGPSGMVRYFNTGIEQRLEKLRVDQNVAADIWPLLMIPESQLAGDALAKARKASAAKLQEFMTRGLRIGARDFGLLCKHAAHEENLRGLVLMIQSGDAMRFEILPYDLAPGDFVSIAHPLLVQEEQRREFSARLAREGRVPPFDQWKGAGAAPKLNLDGLRANPADLMLHLEARGWRRGRPSGEGMIASHSKTFPDLALRAIVEYTGIPTIYGGRWGLQAITGCGFENEFTGQRLSAEKVNPIVLSAVIEDLAGLKQ
jgi:hypothetical protein